MSISDVMSRVAAIQELIGQTLTPGQGPSAAGGSTSGSSSFGDALTSSSTGATGSDGSTASSQAELASILEQSAAEQSLTAGLSDDGGDGSGDGTGDSSFSLPSLPDLSALTSLSSGSTGTAALAALEGGGSSSLDSLDSLDSLLPASASAQAAATPAVATGAGTTGNGQGVLNAAESQIGVTEQPPGSNDGPEIAGYRSSVAGAQAGEPWCAYFASWAAAQAGEPLGPAGQGFGSVADLTSWAASTGRLLPSAATPSPGDLVLFGDRHVGIVESVNPDGSLTTVEGNYGNAVTQVHRSPAEATGYVQM
jgi:CHAP domain